MSEVIDAKHVRRRAVRNSCRVAIQLFMRYSGGYGNKWEEEKIEIPGRLLDLGTEGALLYTKETFSEGQEVKLAIFLPDNTRIITDALVRTCKPVEGNGGYATKVRFSNAPDAGQKAISKFLKGLDVSSN